MWILPGVGIWVDMSLLDIGILCILVFNASFLKPCRSWFQETYFSVSPGFLCIVTVRSVLWFKWFHKCAVLPFGRGRSQFACLNRDKLCCAVPYRILSWLMTIYSCMVYSVFIDPWCNDVIEHAINLPAHVAGCTVGTKDIWYVEPLPRGISCQA